LSRSARGTFTNELLKTPSTFAQSAIVAIGRDQVSVFLLHAATALEQLAKAFLASKHPSLLIDRDFDALLHAVGLPQAAKRPPSRMRTINMETALQRCSLLVPALMRLDKELTTLREVRNGLVHLGLSSGSSPDVLLPFLQATDILLTELSTEPSDYWGESRPFVSQTLRKAVESNRDHVDRMVRQGKAAFARRFQDIDPQWKGEVIKMTVSSYELDRLERQLWSCPACGTDALTEGRVEPDYEFDEEVDDGEFMVHAELKSLTFYTQRLHCRVCGLRLDSAQQIEAASVPDNWVLEDPDVEQVNAWEARWAEFDDY
jgi:hypothetical protein